MNDPKLGELFWAFLDETTKPSLTLFKFLDYLVKEGWISDFDWREDSPKHQKVKSE